MIVVRYCFLVVLMLSAIAAAHSQQQPGTKNDSIAQSRVIDLLEAEHILSYYDENINTPGDFIYSSQIATILKQKPGADFKDYWVQVTDHRRYDNPNIFLNFFVDPENWEVFYFDTKTNLLWTWDNWKKQSKNHKS